MPVQHVVASPAGKGVSPGIQRAVARVAEIGSLPEVTARILEVMGNPRATVRQVHDIVRADPALAARVLKIVNSSFYGLPAQIASLERAIIMLGLGTLKNLALAISVLRLIRTVDLGSGFTTRDLWRHCVAVAVAARQIAQTGRAVQPDEAFVAGLVHDLGLIVGQQLFPAQVAEVVERCAAERQDFCACENAVVGAAHPEIGALIAEKWKFPPALRNAIKYHHDPAALRSEQQHLATAVYLADTLACAAQHGLWLMAAHQAGADWMFAVVNVPLPELDRLRAELPLRLGEAEQIFSDI